MSALWIALSMFGLAGLIIIISIIIILNMKV